MLMKIAKLSLIVVAAAAVVLGLSGLSFAFHSGGVAECTGCHEMHGAPGSFLLQGSDDSSTCLNCHSASGASSYHIATNNADQTGGPGTWPYNMTPGGDFAWLKKTIYWTLRSRPATNDGDTHGHNIIAADFGYAADKTNVTAPGGTFVAANLACTSCHDQHGQVRWVGPSMTAATTGAPIIGSGSYATSATPAAGEAIGTYRLLRSQLSDQGHAPGSPSYAAMTTPVVAAAPGSYNRSEGVTQTRVAYGTAMSDYCGSCHPNMHTGTAGLLRHPQGVTVSGTIVANYNSYVKSGDLTGTSANSYNSIVPFEEGVDISGLSQLRTHAVTNDSQLSGMGATATVMCLSCHRAHASAFPEMTRWSNEGEFIVYNSLYPGTDNAGASYSMGYDSADYQLGMYGRPATQFATYQRSLCNKCHAKD
jgi:predicted CXXCH cytochrome family protein